MSQYPEKFPAWLETRDATQYGQACPQPGLSSATASLYGQFLSHDEEKLKRRASTDPEDCLTLDVYTKNVSACAPFVILIPSTRRRGKNLQLGEDVFDWINVFENYNQHIYAPHQVQSKRLCHTKRWKIMRAGAYLIYTYLFSPS